MGHVLAVTLACCAAPLADWDFARALDSLQRTDTRVVGRDALVVSYKVFIADNGEHPYVAIAMLELSYIYGHSNPATGLRADLAQANRWQERAASIAPRGSALWLKTHERLAFNCIYNDAKRATAILDDIAKSFPNDSLALARVEKSRMSLALVQGRDDDAFGHAEKLFAWYDDSARIPKDGYAKWELDTLMAGAGSELVASIQRSLPAPKATAKLERLRSRYAWSPGVSEMVAEAVKTRPE